MLCLSLCYACPHLFILPPTHSTTPHIYHLASLDVVNDLKIATTFSKLANHFSNSAPTFASSAPNFA